MELIPSTWMPVIWKSVSILVVILISLVFYRFIRRGLLVLGDTGKLSQPVVAILVRYILI